MGRNKSSGEVRNRQMCITMKPSEYKLIDDARQALSEQRGRDISMREFFIMLCKTVCYNVTTDKGTINGELDNIITELSDIRKLTNNAIYRANELKEGLYADNEE